MCGLVLMCAMILAGCSQKSMQESGKGRQLVALQEPLDEFSLPLSLVEMSDGLRALALSQVGLFVHRQIRQINKKQGLQKS